MQRAIVDFLATIADISLLRILSGRGGNQQEPRGSNDEKVVGTFHKQFLLPGPVETHKVYLSRRNTVQPRHLVRRWWRENRFHSTWEALSNKGNYFLFRAGVDGRGCKGCRIQSSAA